MISVSFSDKASTVAGNWLIVSNDPTELSMHRDLWSFDSLLTTEIRSLTMAFMESFFTRYRNLVVLLAMLMAQIVGLGGAGAPQQQRHEHARPQRPEQACG